jgi:nitrile hydratase subunit beta
VNGPQDLGGQMGFGPINPEPEATEPLFHAPWERRALAVSLASAALGHWTTDRSRHTRESLSPSVYYTSSYYEIWIRALIELLQQEGLVTAQDFAAGRAVDPSALTKRPPLVAAMVAPSIAKGSPYNRESSDQPKFTAGQRVSTVNDHPTGHTRLPRYARGRIGEVEAVRGVFVFPDAMAHGPDNPQWCYTIVFRASDLWGAQGDPNSTVSIDAFEPYLRAAS